MMGTPEKMFPFVLFMCIDVKRCFKMLDYVCLSSLLDDTFEPREKRGRNSSRYQHQI